MKINKTTVIKWLGLIGSIVTGTGIILSGNVETGIGIIFASLTSVSVLK